MQHDEITDKQCHICQEKDLQKLRSDLSECKKRGQGKDRKIKALDKKVFILTAVVIAIGAIFGKEAIDAISEWIGSFNEIKSSVDDLIGLRHPSPGALPLFALAFVASGTRKRSC